jgi:hypothetical protein
VLGVTAADNCHEDRAVSGHHEAREALVLSVAGMTAIMLIESLVLLILY